MPSNPAVLAILNLPFDELIQVQQIINAEVAKRSATEIEAQKGKLAAMASALGVNIGSLFGIKERAGNDTAQRPRRKREGKCYRNPDTGEEWHGLGKKPQWLKDKETAGQDRSAFEVPKNVQREAKPEK